MQTLTTPATKEPDTADTIAQKLEALRDFREGFERLISLAENEPDEQRRGELVEVALLVGHGVEGRY